MRDLSDNDVMLIIQFAINHSVPGGLGNFHYKTMNYSLDDLWFYKDRLDTGTIYVDYFEGRMVKLVMTKKDDKWQFEGGTPKPDYQSWSKYFPTYDALVEAAIGRD